MPPRPLIYEYLLPQAPRNPPMFPQRPRSAQQQLLVMTSNNAKQTKKKSSIFLSPSCYPRIRGYQQLSFLLVKMDVFVVKLLTKRDFYMPQTMPYKENPRSGAYVVAPGQDPRWLGFGRYLETRTPSGKESVSGILPKTKIVHHTMCNKPPGECLFFCGLEADAFGVYFRRKLQVDMSD